MPTTESEMRDFSEEIDRAIDLLFKLNERMPKKKVLLEEDRIIYLQVILFMIPYGGPLKRKFLKLHHSLYGDEPEICLFVPNRKTDFPYKKTTDELIDFVIDHYTELLEKHKIKGIKTIMPLKQLRSEYGTYELRRKLVHRFDLFLCKNSLLYNPRFLTALGKIFTVAKKLPLGISFPKEDVDFDPDFQKNIDRAIYTSTFYIRRYSDNYSIPIGRHSHTRSQLKENLETVLSQLFDQNLIPGGLKNIKAMNLWPSQSKSIPLFINTELPVGMKVPNVGPRKRNRPRGVEGELSTQPNKKVVVMQNGEVFVTKIENSSGHEMSDSEDDNSFDDGSDNEMTEEDEQTKGRTDGDEEESDMEDDEEIEKKEADLMRGKMFNGENSFSETSVKVEEETEEEEEEEEEEDDKEKVCLNPERNENSSQNGRNRSNNQKSKLKKKALTKGQKKNFIKAKKGNCIKATKNIVGKGKSLQKGKKQKI